MSKNKGGRPSKFTKELALEICAAIATSKKGTKRLCEENSHWPSQFTIFLWLRNNDWFSQQYAISKAQQAEYLVDHMLEIIEDSKDDYIVDGNGKVVSNRENVYRSRLKLDTIKWLACKLIPKVYGDRVKHEGTLSIEDSFKELK